MRVVINGDPFIPFGQGGAGGSIHGHIADRRGEHGGRWHGDAGHGDVMRWPQHSDTLNGQLAQAVECRRRHRARIDVAGVWGHQRDRRWRGGALRCP